MYPWKRLSNNTLELALHVHPGAKCNAVSKVTPDALNMHIHAAPREGEANVATVKFVAEVFQVRKSQVVLVAGHKSRDKVVRLDVVLSDEELLQRVQQYID